MGMLDPNTLIGILSGKLGDLVFSRLANGKVVVRRRPVRRAPPTASEIASIADFRRAQAYVFALGEIPRFTRSIKRLRNSGASVRAAWPWRISGIRPRSTESLPAQTRQGHRKLLASRPLMTSRSAAFRSASRFRTARFSSRAKPH